MCEYCEPDASGNLADIDKDGNSLFTYLEDCGANWVLITEVSTLCCGSECWTNIETKINNCPMCGRKLGGDEE